MPCLLLPLKQMLDDITEHGEGNLWCSGHLNDLLHLLVVLGIYLVPWQRKTVIDGTGSATETFCLRVLSSEFHKQ